MRFQIPIDDCKRGQIEGCVRDHQHEDAAGAREDCPKYGRPGDRRAVSLNGNYYEGETFRLSRVFFCLNVLTALKESEQAFTDVESRNGNQCSSFTWRMVSTP